MIAVCGGFIFGSCGTIPYIAVAIVELNTLVSLSIYTESVEHERHLNASGYSDLDQSKDDCVLLLYIHKALCAQTLYNMSKGVVCILHGFPLLLCVCSFSQLSSPHKSPHLCNVK